MYYCTVQVDKTDPEYGWEYASLGRHTFHTTRGKFDVVRRRRHVRKLVNERPGASCRAVFAPVEDAKKKPKVFAPEEDAKKKPKVPRMHLEFKGEETNSL